MLLNLIRSEAAQSPALCLGPGGRRSPTPWPSWLHCFHPSLFKPHSSFFAFVSAHPSPRRRAAGDTAGSTRSVPPSLRSKTTGHHGSIEVQRQPLRFQTSNFTLQTSFHRFHGPSCSTGIPATGGFSIATSMIALRCALAQCSSPTPVAK